MDCGNIQICFSGNHFWSIWTNGNFHKLWTSSFKPISICVFVFIIITLNYNKFHLRITASYHSSTFPSLRTKQHFTRCDLHWKAANLQYASSVLDKSHNKLALCTKTFSTISCIMAETSLSITRVMSELRNKFLWFSLSPQHRSLAQPWPGWPHKTKLVYYFSDIQTLHQLQHYLRYCNTYLL
jgi:hypothetical protein